MPATTDEVKLIEKIVRAKMLLETAMREHSDSCALEDMESIAPCSCGADKTNKPIKEALKVLKLD